MASKTHPTRFISLAGRRRQRYRKEDGHADRLAAAEAATDTAATEAQRRAGNYKKGLVYYRGLEIKIENPAGSARSGKTKDGSEWSHVLPYAYGYIRRTTARDGDAVDVFLGPNLKSDVVFAIDQCFPASGRWDEVKVMVGWTNKDDAKAAYLASYSAGWQGFQAITAMTFEQFKRWIERGNHKRPTWEQVTEKYARERYDLGATGVKPVAEAKPVGKSPVSPADSATAPEHVAPNDPAFERLHPRQHGQFAAKPGGEKEQPRQASHHGGEPEGAKKAQPVSIGGKDFKTFRQGNDWFFRSADNAAWVKAKPHQAEALAQRAAPAPKATEFKNTGGEPEQDPREDQLRQLHQQHQEEALGNVPHAQKKFHERHAVLSAFAQGFWNAIRGKKLPEAGSALAAIKGKHAPRLARAKQNLERAQARAAAVEAQKNELARQMGKSLKELGLGYNPGGGRLTKDEFRMLQRTMRDVARQHRREGRDLEKQQRKAEKGSGGPRPQKPVSDKQVSSLLESMQRAHDEARGAAAKTSQKWTNHHARLERDLLREERTRAKRQDRFKQREKEAGRSIADMGASKVAREYGQQLTVKQTEKSPQEIAGAKQQKLADKKAQRTRARAEEEQGTETAKMEARHAGNDMGMAPDDFQSYAQEVAGEMHNPEDEEYNQGVGDLVKASGLTPEKIDKIEDSGRDWTSVPGFDNLVKKAASDYPTLGLGAVAGSSEGGDPEQLWEILKRGQKAGKEWWDPHVVEETKRRIAAAQQEPDPWDQQETEPFRKSGALEKYVRLKHYADRQRLTGNMNDLLREAYARKPAAGQRGLWTEEDEAKHPRDAGGEFAEKGQEVIPKKSDKTLDSDSENGRIGSSAAKETADDPTSEREKMSEYPILSGTIATWRENGQKFNTPHLTQAADVVDSLPDEEKEKIEAYLSDPDAGKSRAKKILARLKDGESWVPKSGEEWAGKELARREAEAAASEEKETARKQAEDEKQAAAKREAEIAIKNGKFEANLYKSAKGWKIEGKIDGLHDGQKVEVRQPGMGYTVRGTIHLDGRDNYKWDSPDKKTAWIDDAEVIPDPLPAIKDGKLTLPNLSGHAHSKSWQKGDIVRVDAQYYKIAAAKPDRYGLHITYTMTPSSEAAYETRTARVKVDGNTPHEFVGQAIAAGGGKWLQVKAIQQQTHREDGGMGEVVGRTFYASGNYISAEKAKALNAKHPSALNPEKWGDRGEVVDDAKIPAGAKKVSTASTGTHGAVSLGSLYIHGDDVYMHHPGYYDDYRETVRRIPGAAKELREKIKQAIGSASQKEINLASGIGGTRMMVCSPDAAAAQEHV